MKILTGTQIRELDKYTIEHEPIKSIDLMERAAKALTRAITRVWDDNTSVVVFAGPGNNGGDALAVARMMGEQGYSVKVYLFNVSGTLSADCSANKERLAGAAGVTFIEVTNEFDPPELPASVLVIDGLFGSGTFGGSDEIIGLGKVGNDICRQAVIDVCIVHTDVTGDVFS